MAALVDKVTLQISILAECGSIIVILKKSCMTTISEFSNV